MDRRRVLGLARNLLLGVGVVGGGGYVLAQNVIETMQEHDLTRVGNGRPTIVQIHDPQCQLCLALQRETRKALGRFDDDALDYVVANIRTPGGQQFANRYGAQHVTLLLFDSKGDLKDVLQGQRRASELGAAFRRLSSS